jgi:hypothetical protein
MIKRSGDGQQFGKTLFLCYTKPVKTLTYELGNY